MTTTVMPRELKSMIRLAFLRKDVDAVAYYNRIWYSHIKEVEAERQAMILAEDLEEETVDNSDK